MTCHLDSQGMKNTRNGKYLENIRLYIHLFSLNCLKDICLFKTEVLTLYSWISQLSSIIHTQNKGREKHEWTYTIARFFILYVVIYKC